MDVYITSSYGWLLDDLDRHPKTFTVRPFSVGHTTSMIDLPQMSSGGLLPTGLILKANVPNYSCDDRTVHLR